MKRKNIALLTTSILIILTMFSGCGGHSGEKEYTKALAAWKAGDLVRARTFFEKSIRKTSENDQKSAALNQLGLVLWSLGEVDAAAETFVKSCNLTDELTDANLNMGIALFHAQRMDEAEVALNTVLGVNPDNKTAAALLGMIEMQKSNWTSAYESLSKTVSADPRNPAGQNALALAELHNNKLSSMAIKRLQQVASAFPEYTPAAYNLAVIYDQWLNDSENARSWYQTYLRKAGPDDLYAGAAQNAVARLGGQAQPDSPPVRPQDAARLMTEGASLLSQKEYQKAADKFRMAVQADPNAKAAHYNLGHALFNLKQYHNAVEAYIHALKQDPRYADARYMLAYSYVQLKQWEDAEREGTELAKVDADRGKQMLDYIASTRKR